MPPPPPPDGGGVVFLKLLLLSLINNFYYSSATDLGHPVALLMYRNPHHHHHQSASSSPVGTQIATASDPDQDGEQDINPLLLLKPKHPGVLYQPVAQHHQTKQWRGSPYASGSPYAGNGGGGGGPAGFYPGQGQPFDPSGGQYGSPFDGPGGGFGGGPGGGGGGYPTQGMQQRQMPNDLQQGPGGSRLSQQQSPYDSPMGGGGGGDYPGMPPQGFPGGFYPGIGGGGPYGGGPSGGPSGAGSGPYGGGPSGGQSGGPSGAGGGRNGGLPQNLPPGILDQMNQMIGPNRPPMPTQYNRDGSVNPQYVMAFEQLLLNALAQANMRGQSTPNPNMRNNDTYGRYHIVPNQYGPLGYPMGGGSQQEPLLQPTPAVVTPGMVIATHPPLGNEPVTLGPLSSVDRQRLSGVVPGQQLPATFALQGVASNAVLPAHLQQGHVVATLQPPRFGQQPNQGAPQEPTTEEPPIMPQTDGAYPPRLVGPPKTNGRQPVKCLGRKYFIDVAKLPDVACCYNKAFNTRAHACVHNKIMNASEYEKYQLVQQGIDPAIFNQSATNSSNEKPVGVPYKPEVIGVPTPDGRQAIKCLIKSYLVPITKLFDVMCCAEIPFNVKEAFCRQGVIISRGLPTTTIRPDPSRTDGAFRPDVSGKPTSVGTMPVECMDSKYFLPIGQIPHSWCCKSKVFIDTESKCNNGNVVPLMTTTVPPRPTPRGVYLPDVVGPITDGRQTVKCYNRTYSVIAQRMREVKCCGDKLFSRQEALCVDAKLQSLAPSMTTTPRTNLPSGVDELPPSSDVDYLPNANSGFSKPVLAGDPSGNRQPVRCLDKVITVSLLKLSELGCCGNKIFNTKNANCVNGKIALLNQQTSAAPATLPGDNLPPEAITMAVPTMMTPSSGFTATPSAGLPSGSGDLNDQTPSAGQALNVPGAKGTNFEILNILPGGRRAINCGGRKFIVPEEKIPEAACCGATAYNTIQAYCKDGNVVKFGTTTIANPAMNDGSLDGGAANELDPTGPPPPPPTVLETDVMSSSQSQGLSGPNLGSATPVELSHTLPDGRRVVKCLEKKFAISETKISEVACCGEAMFGIFEGSCVDGKVVLTETSTASVPATAAMTTTEPAAKSEEADLPPPIAPSPQVSSQTVARVEIELGDLLPDGRQVVKCGQKKFMIPTTKISTADCCGTVAFNTLLATCINNKLVERPKQPTSTTMKPTPRRREDDSTLPDVVNTVAGRMVLQCPDQRAFMLKDERSPIYCCGPSAFDPNKYRCAKGQLIDRDSGAASAPSVTPAAALSMKHVVNNDPSVTFDEDITDAPSELSELSLLYPEAGLMDTVAFASTGNQDEMDDVLFPSVSYRSRSRLANWLNLPPSHLESDPLVFKSPAESSMPAESRQEMLNRLEATGSTFVTTKQGRPTKASAGQRNATASQPLLLSSLAAASGLAKGVFTMRCEDNYWQTRGPPVFYVCCGSTMQDLLQKCTVNTTQPSLVSYNENNQPNTLSAMEALVAEDELTDMLLQQQQGSQALKNPSDQAASRSLSLELMPTDREYSMPYSIGQYFGAGASSMMVPETRQTQGKAHSFRFKPRSSSHRQRQRCPDDKFCCGGSVYRKTNVQVCCQGRYHMSSTKQLGCCGREKYDISTHECNEAKIYARRH